MGAKRRSRPKVRIDIKVEKKPMLENTPRYIDDNLNVVTKKKEPK